MVLLAAVGALAYDVGIVWRKLPAALVTLVLGVTCLASLGLAMAALARTAPAALALTQGTLIPLAFISDVFLIGADRPGPLAVAGSLLPLKHFAAALTEALGPAAGTGFAPGHLAVTTLYAAAGLAVARRWFGWSPRGAAPEHRAPPEHGAAPVADRPPRPLTVTGPGRWTTTRLLPGQVRHALLGLRRDPLSVFFTVVFPALLLLMLFPLAADGGTVRGLPLGQYLFPALTAYAAAVCGYVTTPEVVTGARAASVLKRMRATPLPVRWYVAGQVTAALLTTGLSMVLLGVVAMTTAGVRLDPVRLPAVLLALLTGALCFAALGLAVAALLRTARSVVAVTLGTLLPLCFVSGVFVVADAPLPTWADAVATALPLRHLLEALLLATRPGVAGPGIAWAHLALVAGWAVAGWLVVRGRGLTG